MAEVFRVLKPGGRLHVADWGPPSDPLTWLAFGLVRLGDGLEPTRDNPAGLLPAIFEGAGLAGAGETDRLRTIFGVLSLFLAARPTPPPPTMSRQ